MIEFNDCDIDSELTADEGGATWVADGDKKFKGYSVFVNDVEILFSESELKSMLRAIRDEL